MRASVQFIALLLFCRCVVVAQTITLSVSGISNGGGFSSGPTMGMQSSAGVSAIDSVGSSDGSFSMQGGFVAVQSVFAGTAFTGALNLETGWNLASVPALQSDYRTSVLFPAAISHAYSYQGQYTPCDTLRNGVGYWVKYAADTTVNFQGTGIVSDTVAVAHSWNLVGTVSYPALSADVTPIPPTTVTTQFYGFRNGTGYFIADTLIPGKAYWVKVQNAGGIIIEAGSGSTSSPYGRPTLRSLMEEEFGTLRITDAGGQSRTLYFSTSKREVDPGMFELPPVAPGDLLDVRFGNGSMVAVPDSEGPGETSVGISSARYPITVQWENAGVDGSAILVYDQKETMMNGSGTLHVNNPDSRLRMRLNGMKQDALPHEFTLFQNYPNPFNPTTEIKFSVEKMARTSLEVYDVLGQRVATLFNENADPGKYYTVRMDGLNMASGVYFYTLRSGSRVDTRKMMLLK